MKAMILAAGRGERMGTLTDQTPKPLLKVGRRCLIEHHIDRLVAAGITEIVINLAYHGRQIRDRLGAGEKYGAVISYSDERDKPLDTGGGIFQALPLLGNGPFLVLNADIWTDYPFANLPVTIDGVAHLILVTNPPHHPDGDFVLNSGWLVAGNSNKLTFSGIGLYKPELFSKDFTEGAFPLAPLLREAIGLGQVSGELYQGLWVDVGTPERLAEINRTALPCRK